MTEPHRVVIGFSADEIMAVNTAEASLRSYCGSRVAISRISRLSLCQVYDRPTTTRDGRLWDDISDAPMSTDHAIARFFIPWQCGYQGWALFTDGDVLFRRDVSELFALADDRYAVMCVQHPPLQAEGMKKDGAVQLPYHRKNWSSVMLMNCGHPSNHQLTLEAVNTWPGRTLHAFSWLANDEIGALDPAWNYLVGVTAHVPNPAIVHFTEGVPVIPGHEYDPYADEWRRFARVAGYRIAEPAAQEVG